jgi:cytochrome c-type biogenesis protein CcmH/NrfF
VLTIHKKKFRIFFLLPLLLLLYNGPVAHGKDITLMELKAVTDLIMSPGCDYMYTLSNCPSADAEQMREIVKDRLVTGESREEILAYFEKVYGPKILAQPAKRGFYFVAWWFPYFITIDVFILVGVFLYLWRKRPSKNTEAPESIAVVEKTDVDESIEVLLEEEVEKFRGLK